ncbi:MAG: hypothetical protein CTY15_00755 [Methylocystis sp.]|nr:MAG: hypothetical protein CTY15_00755 [Methylocystis sp.]
MDSGRVMIDDYQDTVSFAELIAKLKEKEFELQRLVRIQSKLRSNGRKELLALSVLLAGQSRRTLQPGLCRKCMVSVAGADGLHDAVRTAECPPVSIADYIATLSAALMTPFDSRIRLILDVDPDLSLDEERTQWIGLLFSEAASNALKHAFPGLTGGVIAVGLHGDGDRLKLTVSDNGAGFDPRPNGEPRQGLEFMQCAAHRLAGELDVTSSRMGTTISLICPPGRRMSES